MSRWLFQVGALLLVAGAVAWLIERGGLTRLPGDFVIRRKGWALYAPLGTSLLISVVLTVLLNLFFRRR